MRACLILIVVLALSACGFQTVYGDRSGGGALSAPQQFSQIEIGNIPDREGQILRNALVDRLHSLGGPMRGSGLYALNVSPVQESLINLDITKTADATRAQLKMTTFMQLKDVQGSVLLQRRLISITSMNQLASEFTNRVSEQAARESVLQDLAQQIETQLSLYFGR